MNVPSLDSNVTIPQDVVFRSVDGEAVLLHLASGHYFSLNEVGTRIWELLSQDGSLRSAHAAMLQEYDVDADRLEADIVELAAALAEKGLVRMTPMGSGAQVEQG